MDPVDFIRLFKGTRYHRRLHHFDDLRGGGHTQKVGFSMMRASSPDHEVSCLCLFLFDSRVVQVDLDSVLRAFGHAA